MRLINRHWQTLPAALVGFALALAALLRFQALDFGLPSWLHPDEYSFVFFPLNFWSGDLNPHFFTYPTLQYYLLSILYLAYFGLQFAAGSSHTIEQFVAFHYFWDRTDLMWLARSLSAFMGWATVGWTALLARIAYGRKAAVIAALLMAVCPLHVRQSHLAGVDTALTLWFTGVVWAALRLKHGRRNDYLLAGWLVGLAAATKYPGALASLAVLSAHLSAGRCWNDKRVYAAGGIALCTFLFCSPYVLLDFEGFIAYFGQQAAHLSVIGSDDFKLGWWYHLRFTFANGLGWPVSVLGVVASYWLWKKRQFETAVILFGFVGLFLAVGSSQRLFMRYALPLLPLVIVFAAGLLALLPARIVPLVVVLVMVKPTWSSLHQVRLLDRTDTRVEARHWIEKNVPPGTAIGNFGGWAGDVGVRTFESLWWEVSLFERRFGRARLNEALHYLEQLSSTAPHYSYGVQRTNMDAASGSFAEIERLETPFVVVHRHPLGFSNIDSTFAVELERRGQQVFAAKVKNLWSSAVRFDPFDAFYLPIAAADAVERPGPDIEIWRIPGCHIPDKNPTHARALVSRAYTRGITETLRKDGAQGALDLLHRAEELDPTNPEVYFVGAYFAQKAGDLEEADANYRRSLELEPTNSAINNNLAMLYESMGATDHAEIHLLEQLHLAPWKRSVYLSLAGFYRRRENYHKAAQFYKVLTSRFSGYAEDHERLGVVYEKLGNAEAAEAAYLKAVEINSTNQRIYLLLARLHRSQDRIKEMVDACLELVAINANNLQAHKLLAYGFRHMGKHQQASKHARIVVSLAPTDPEADELRRWLEDLP